MLCFGVGVCGGLWICGFVDLIFGVVGFGDFSVFLGGWFVVLGGSWGLGF